MDCGKGTNSCTDDLEIGKGLRRSLSCGVRSITSTYRYLLAVTAETQVAMEETMRNKGSWQMQGPVQSRKSIRKLTSCVKVWGKSTIKFTWRGYLGEY